MKLTDEELRRWRSLTLTPAQHDGIIDELLAARRVVEASRQHLLAAVSPQRIIDSIIDYDKTVTR